MLCNIPPVLVVFRRWLVGLISNQLGCPLLNFLEAVAREIGLCAIYLGWMQRYAELVFLGSLAHWKRFRHDIVVTTISLCFSSTKYSPCFCLGLSLVTSFHNVEPKLDILQCGTKRGMPLWIFPTPWHYFQDTDTVVVKCRVLCISFCQNRRRNKALFPSHVDHYRSCIEHKRLYQYNNSSERENRCQHLHKAVLHRYLARWCDDNKLSSPVMIDWQACPKIKIATLVK